MKKAKVKISNHYECLAEVARPETDQVPGRPTVWVQGSARKLAPQYICEVNRDLARRHFVDSFVIHQLRPGEEIKKITCRKVDEAQVMERIGAPALFDLSDLLAVRDDGATDAFTET